ncbi:MAG: tRNA (adenosine(37)-N6)-dimethylallyltransferase MiaA [Candidatus Omnitrophota bacterium]
MATRQRYTRKQIIFLTGPTAVGKTKAAIKLAKIINGEIISCDSMQVYKGMDIISQKPTLFQQGQVPHHMIGVISPAKNFNVADYRKKALNIIKDIYKRNKTPIFVGGTGFYVKALIYGLFPSPKQDFKLRQNLKSEAEGRESDYLHKKLQAVDPETAKFLHPNDLKRIIRALEVCCKAGAPMSELKKNTKGLSDSYRVKIFCLNMPREKLYDRISKRIDAMFAQGIISECRRLKNAGLSLTASQALGCKEVFAYLDKKCLKTEAIELLKRNTRRFAKRQLSLFRNLSGVEWIDITDKETPVEIAKKIEAKII